MPDEIKNIKTYRKKERMLLSRSIRNRKRYIEVVFGNNDAARVVLPKEKIAYQPEKWLFERETGVQFSESIVSKKLKEMAHEAGITKRAYPHLFRYSFATHLIEQGTDLKIIKELI